METPRRTCVDSKAGCQTQRITDEDLLLEEDAGRGAFVAGALAGDAALGFCVVRRGECGEVKDAEKRWRGERCRGVSWGRRGRLREVWADGAECGAACGSGHHACAVVGAMAAAAGGEVDVGVFC